MLIMGMPQNKGNKSIFFINQMMTLKISQITVGAHLENMRWLNDEKLNQFLSSSAGEKKGWIPCSQQIIKHTP